MVNALGLPKVVRIRKGQDFYPCIIGLHILKLYKQGYKKFEIIEETNEEIVLKAIRRKEEI